MPFSELGGLADLICHGSSGKLGTVYHLQNQSMWAAGTSGKLGPLCCSHNAQHVEGLRDSAGIQRSSFSLLYMRSAREEQENQPRCITCPIWPLNNQYP